MRRLRYRFQTLNKKLPKTEDLNIYTYLDKKDSKGRIEWASIGTLEKLEVIEGIQLS